MVRALLERRVTRYRAPVRPAGRDEAFDVRAEPPRGPWPYRPSSPADAGQSSRVLDAIRARQIACPWGVPGDRLWVRETWQHADWTDDGEPFIGYAADGARRLIDQGIPEAETIRLMDVWAELSDPENYEIDNRAADRRWRQANHMPRWASRIELEVVSVRIEQPTHISPAEALKSGIVHSTLNDPRVEFRWDWEARHGVGSWVRNPWVWVVGFKRAAMGRGDEAARSDEKTLEG